MTPRQRAGSLLSIGVRPVYGAGVGAVQEGELESAAQERRNRRLPESQEARQCNTRALQDRLGHRSIQHTVRYTELSPTRFKDFWRE